MFHLGKTSLIHLILLKTGKQVKIKFGLQQAPEYNEQSIASFKQVFVLTELVVNGI